ncbi:MAG: DUF87 domain-containing protein [Oscillospiraceae bacterium]|nr:DUF87 domain-containing protein [Oscillospiraceae bacterium]
MRKFYDSGEYFVLSSYRINAVPISDDGMVGVALAKTICEDACYLSSTGNGQTAIEILRVADRKLGSRIDHILTIRTHDSSEQNCVIRQEALANGILSSLRRSGYVVEEIAFNAYKDCLLRSKTDAVWALTKRDIREYGIRKTYTSPPIVESVDWEKIYTALDGSGCSLCIQIIPSLLSDDECKLVTNNVATCSQAVDGIVPELHDRLASPSAERWKYFAGNALQPFAKVNLMVIGSVSDAASVAARVRQSVRGIPLCTVSVSEFATCGIYNHPWIIACALREKSGTDFIKWTSDEVSRVFWLPFQSNYFIGVDSNVFSLLPENDLLPVQLTTRDKNQKLCLGKTVFSSQSLFMPHDQLLLHTAVIGKSGVGKTTLLKQIITQLSSRNIPVLIMEPVKREYRDLVAGMENGKIFTVERPVVPLHINPFYVPKNVTLGEYKNSLLSAFKAAFSLPDPLPALFEKTISESYTMNGWTDTNTSEDDSVTLFDMAEFIRIFKQVIANSSYSGEVKGNMMSGGAFRLQSLIERCPYTFDTLRSTPVEDLLTGCTVLEMGCLEPEQKSLVSALTLINILTYLKATRHSDTKLKNIILIDEAHALLDRGEGSTQEEKSLNDAMTQLMINVITEIRAYGVGIIFSDQSPSRVGSRMLDNVDNVISFRLSGKEAKALKENMGEEDSLCDVLPALSTGEFILKNRFLRSALPMRADYISVDEHENHISDEQIMKKQSAYLNARAKEFRPFSNCECSGCGNCTLAVREKAKMYATRIFAERQLKLRSPEEIAAHIIKIPDVISSRYVETDSRSFDKLCGCVAVHLLRKCLSENNISISQQAVTRLIADMRSQYKKGEV